MDWQYLLWFITTDNLVLVQFSLVIYLIIIFLVFAAFFGEIKMNI